MRARALRVRESGSIALVFRGREMDTKERENDELTTVKEEAEEEDDEFAPAAFTRTSARGRRACAAGA